MKENQHDPERKMWSVKGKQYTGQLIVRIQWAFAPFATIEKQESQEDLADPQKAKNRKNPL